MYDKKHFIKNDDKKVLHKVRKHWVIISVALLSLLGGGALTTNTLASANDEQNDDQNNKLKVNVNQNKQHTLVSGQSNSLGTSQNLPTRANSSNSNSNISNQARFLHSQILLKALGNKSLSSNNSNGNSLASSKNSSIAVPSNSSSSSSNSLSSVGQLPMLGATNKGKKNNQQKGNKNSKQKSGANDNVNPDQNNTNENTVYGASIKLENDAKALRRVSDQIHIEEDEEKGFGKTSSNLSSLKQQESNLRSQEKKDENNYIKLSKELSGSNRINQNTTNPLENSLNINVPDIENYIAQDIDAKNNRDISVGQDYQDLAQMISQQAMSKWNPNLSLNPQNIYYKEGTSDYDDGHIGSDYDRGIVRDDEEQKAQLESPSKYGNDTVSSQNSYSFHNSDFHKYYIQLHYPESDSDSDAPTNSKNQIPSDDSYYLMHTNILYSRPSDIISEDPNISSIYEEYKNNGLNKSDAQQKLDKALAHDITIKIDNGLKNKLIRHGKQIQSNGLNLSNDTTFGVSLILNGNKIGIIYVNGPDNGNRYKQPGIKKLMGNNHIEATNLYGRYNPPLSNYIGTIKGVNKYGETQCVSPNRLTSDDIKRYNSDWDHHSVSDTDNGSGTDLPLYYGNSHIPTHGVGLGLYQAPDGLYFESVEVKVRDMYTNKIIWTHYLDDARPGAVVLSDGNVNSENTNYNKNSDAPGNYWLDFVNRYGNKIASNPEKSYGEMASGDFNNCKFFLSPEIFTYQIPYLSKDEEQQLINQINGDSTSPFSNNGNGLDLPSTHEPDFIDSSYIPNGNGNLNNNAPSSNNPSNTPNNNDNGIWTPAKTTLAQEIFEAARNDGFSPNMAAGLVGNAEHEGAASGNPDQAENDGTGDKGEGIFQFTDDADSNKRTRYLNWCNSQGEQPWTVQSQVDAMHDLFNIPSDLTGYSDSDNYGGTDNDTYYVLNNFEIPSTQNESGEISNRENDAEQALYMFANPDNAVQTQTSSSSLTHSYQSDISNDLNSINSYSAAISNDVNNPQIASNYSASSAINSDNTSVNAIDSAVSNDLNNPNATTDSNANAEVSSAENLYNSANVALSSAERQQPSSSQPTSNSNSNVPNNKSSNFSLMSYIKKHGGDKIGQFFNDSIPTPNSSYTSNQIPVTLTGNNVHTSSFHFPNLETIVEAGFSLGSSVIGNIEKYVGKDILKPGFQDLVKQISGNTWKDIEHSALSNTVKDEISQDKGTEAIADSIWSAIKNHNSTFANNVTSDVTSVVGDIITSFLWKFSTQSKNNTILKITPFGNVEFTEKHGLIHALDHYMEMPRATIKGIADAIDDTGSNSIINGLVSIFTAGNVGEVGSWLTGLGEATLEPILDHYINVLENYGIDALPKLITVRF